MDNNQRILTHQVTTVVCLINQARLLEACLLLQEAGDLADFIEFERLADEEWLRNTRHTMYDLRGVIVRLSQLN